MKIFTLDQYNEIIFEGFSSKLPATTISIIEALIKEVDSVSPPVPSQPEKKPVFAPNKKHRGRRNDSHEDWNAVRNFKTTVIEKKEGLEKTLNDMRACLNKISAKNYDGQKDQIISLIEDIKSHTDNEIGSVAQSIYEIASNNKFNSLIYAGLYKELVSAFPELVCPFDAFVSSFVDSIIKISSVDPNTDYDKYCEYNKLNDRRKAISTFLSNLVKVEYLSYNRLIDIVVGLQNTILESIDIENKSNEVDEITENVYIFITMLHSDLKSHQEWDKVIENVHKCASMKAKDKKSLSSRAVFKYMDIVDMINKAA